ncbi:hypothetical protein [Vibrio crassostreae]|uniref:hypothetical protein n=1 Tax=Vibrio crassostreae TaxID=246167 RepID=UPI000F46C8D2|nr:hypothetical protein [Vibrio crassostreae]ROO57894.1 hypothetical protein EDB56_1011042 [Vibrio crassostreae]ROO76835.1 hypothetical protein EDB53_0663 [Vibrio crassostreae]ROR75594.1 hypothetical protein EDB54_1106 [Vibrio crassostreae]TCN99361.1 hypothetical protein EDB50_1011147 [Vibrio crassostreae]TCV33044.1 hypothetical protein EDB70_1011031 [Vibrio crassostreae]
MMDFLINPLVLALVIGPIAGILWTKILNKDSDDDESDCSNNLNVIGNGDITANERSNVQIGKGNQVTNNNHHYNGGQPPRSEGDGELVFFTVIGFITAFVYIRYSDWAVGLCLLFLLFNFAFTLVYRESSQVKLIKLIGYSALFYILFLVHQSPINPYYVAVVEDLKGQGLKAYIEAFHLGELPFSVIKTAIIQAVTLLFSILSAQMIRTTPLNLGFVHNAKRLIVLSIAVAMPFYLLYIDAANGHIIALLGELI